MKKILLCTVMIFLLHAGMAQKNSTLAVDAPKGIQGIIFDENFNGLTSLPAGWVVYQQDSWDMILVQNDEVIFFKQSTGLKTLILSTPLLDLTNASQMTFRFRSKDIPSTLKVGLMTDPSDPTTFQLLTQFVADTSMVMYTVPLGTVTGSYHISFNWVGTYFKSGYLDDVIVYDEGSQNNNPMNVTNALLNAQPLGVLTGNLSWTNPRFEVDGDPLTDLDSIVVAVNGNYYSTLYNPPIGANQMITVSVTLPGLYDATITPYNTAGAGIPNTTPQVWIGLDMPSAPTNVILTQQGNIATLQWSPPLTGLHGGYYNRQVSQYLILRADNWQTYVPGTDSSVVMTVTDPGTFNFSVIPENLTGSGPAGVSNTGVFLTGNYLLWEDFWVSVPAHLWSIQGENYYNWWLYDEAFAGGIAPEMEFLTTSPWFNSYSRAASPPLNTVGMKAVTLEFRHAHTAYGAYELRIETSSDGGTSWNTAFTIPISQTIPAEKRSFVITTNDVGSDHFQFAFTFVGSESELESFSIDDVRLFPTTGVDVAVNTIMLPQVIHPGDQLVPGAVIQNLSADSAVCVAVMKILGSGGAIYSDSLTLSLKPGDVDTVEFKGMNIPEGEFTSYVSSRCLLDNNPLNDTLRRKFVSYKTYQRKIVMLEEATGTWCNYCPGASMGIDDLRKNGYPVAAIAYHGGDSYQTPEGRARLNYYPEITGFPTVMFDGVLSYVGGTHSNSMYSTYLPIVQQRLSLPTPAQVNLETPIMTANALSAKVNVASLSPIRNSNLVIHAVLTESRIQEAWQDQSELNDVERAMFADSTGTPIDLSGKSASLDLTIPLKPFWVKANLELLVFLQDKVTREIFDGDFKIPLTGLEEKSAVSLLLYPNPARDYVRFPTLQCAGIHVFNITGTEIMTINGAAGNYRLDVSQLSSGFYLIRVVDNGVDYYSKLNVIR